MSSLNELVAEYVEVKAKRLKLEKDAEEIKKGREGELSALILQVMAAQGLKSANVEGLGRVVCKETSHYEITDMESLAFAMFKVMVDAAQKGRPMSDGLLLQRRVHKDNLDSFLESIILPTDAEGQPSMAHLGVKKAIRTDLSFTKA